jgi:uncharacterized protein
MGFLFLTAFLLGIGGSLHCLGMCGPLILGLPFNGTTSTKKGYSIIAYFGSKALGYGAMGLILGILGSRIQLILWQQGLSIISGVFILILALFPFVKKAFSFGGYFSHSFNKLYGKVLGTQSIFKYYALGFLNAFLPCGLVYTALIASASFASAFHGFLYMFLFGLGTMPLLVATVLVHYQLSNKWKQYFKYTTLIFSIILGVILILRGLNLGIPYISPSFNEKGKVENCCKH